MFCCPCYPASIICIELWCHSPNVFCCICWRISGSTKYRRASWPCISDHVTNFRAELDIRYVPHSIITTSTYHQCRLKRDASPCFPSIFCQEPQYYVVTSNVTNEHCSCISVLSLHCSKECCQICRDHTHADVSSLNIRTNIIMPVTMIASRKEHCPECRLDICKSGTTEVRPIWNDSKNRWSRFPIWTCPHLIYRFCQIFPSLIVLVWLDLVDYNTCNIDAVLQAERTV
mmetsp:Transcript_18614/g.30463  ORF Transcript_18614/g.30463 Transcript_18614/m.30463 type:complete len:230 (+) Transcript_18614:126-815(+)